SIADRGAQPLLADIAEPAQAQRHSRVSADMEEWAQRAQELARQALAASGTNPRVQRALDAGGVAGLLQAAVAGGEGPARAIRHLFGPSGRQLVSRVSADLHEIITRSFAVELASFVEPLEALGLRSDA